MDGPSIGTAGGGGFIASAFVEIGADLSALRQAEDEAKQIVARIGAMGGGGSIGNPVNGATSGGMMMIQLKVDEQGIRSQLDSFFRSYQAPTIKVQVETEGGGGGYTAGGTTLGGSVSRGGGGLGMQGNQVLAAMQNNLADAQARGDLIGIGRFQDIIASFGGGGSIVGAEPHRYYAPPPAHWSVRPRRRTFDGREDIGGERIQGGMLDRLEDVETSVSEREQNLQAYQSQFAGPGEGLHIGLRRSLMIGYLADRGFRSFSSFVDAQSITAHPERIAAEYALATDPSVITGQRAQLVEATSARAYFSAFESIPIIGGLAGITGKKGELDYNVFKAQQSVGAAISLHATGQAADAGLLALQGDPVGAAKIQAQIANDAAWRQWKVATRYTNYSAEADAEWQSVTDLGNARIARAGREVSGANIASAGSAAASYTFGIASSIEATFSPGSRMSALLERQAGRRITTEAGFNARIAAAAPGSPERARAEQELSAARFRGTADDALEALTEERHTAGSVGTISTAGVAAGLRARHNDFSAGLVTFDQQAANVRRESQGLSQPDQDRIDRSLIAQRSAMVITHNEQVSNAFGNAGASFGTSMLAVQSAALRMQNRGAEADLLGFQGQQMHLAEAMRQQFAQLNFGNIGTILPNLIGLAGQGLAMGANQAAAQFAFQRSLALENYSIGARGEIAGALLANNPRNAHAIGSVARARMELENAPENLRPQLRRALQRELAAEEHELGPVGGHTAIGMSVSSAIGFVGGHDLRGIGYDRIAAGRTLEQGSADLSNGIGSSAPAINANLSKLAQLLPALISVIQAAVNQAPN